MAAARAAERTRLAPASCAIAHTMQTREQEAIELLTHVRVFETLGPKELAQVAAVTVPRTFDAGHVIFREGDQSDTCYVVRIGHARAIREHGDGRTLTLAHFGPGDIFGELAMFDDERRSATVETLDDVEAIAVLGTDMRRLLREHPGARGQARHLARPPAARGQRADRAAVLPDRAEPRRGRPRAARRPGRRPRARASATCS